MEQIHSVDGLRQDHARLCGELAVLKSAEGYDGARLWQTLRDVCMRLSSGLSEHIRSEAQWPVIHSLSLGAAAFEENTRQVPDHYSDLRYLQVITRHITLEDRPFLLNNRYQMLTNFIHGMHCHMDEQEAAWNK